MIEFLLFEDKNNFLRLPDLYAERALNQLLKCPVEILRSRVAEGLYYRVGFSANWDRR
jgi:hypothetical protein